MTENLRGVALSQLANIVGEMADVKAIAHMDQALYGPPDEWPDAALAKGCPVWVRVPGLPQFGIMAGVIDYSDVRYELGGKREGYVGITVPHKLPVTGGVTYSKLDTCNFWPRSTEVPASVQ